MFATDETIAAIASPPGKALRGIMRISGPDTLSVLRDLCGDFPVPDRAARVSVPLDLGSTLGEVDASVLVWPGTMSYTGMPSAEVHLSGAQPILNAALSLALAAGARLAQPGEFTLRAFLAGRLDITEAEAVLGVIDADDKRSLDAALRQMAGGLGKPLRELRSQLLNLLAHLEAGLDFVEDDIEFITQEDLLDNVNRIAKSVKAIEEQVQSRDGGTGSPTVVLRGEPNAGKSSLINALAGNERSIVSPAAGTTRDWIETTISIGGTDVRLIDTAGVESEGSSSSFSAINTLAQRYGEEVQEESQLVVICIDLGQKELTQWQRDAMSCLNDNTIVVGTKSDNEVWLNDEDTSHWLRTSSSTGQGIHELRDAIVHKIQSDSTIEASAVGATAVRCQETLGEASESLGRSVQAIHDSLGEEIVAAELRFALTAIGRVTGEVYTDDILDRIFSEFCIGK